MATPPDSTGPSPQADGSAEPLAQHFDSLRQQYEAAKLGMWLFLATEVLLFGGLFCLYAVARANHPETFAYGSRFLDRGWGTINTAVLIVSSLTMAMAVRCAQCGQRRELIIFLSLTLICAADFMGVKVIEYAHKFHNNLVWGMQFYEPPEGLVIAASASEQAPVQLLPGDPDIGRGLFRATCAGCHGTRGQGLPNSGKSLDTSEFISGLDDDGLLAFLLKGRMVGDPLNTTGISMLPRGGNPRLTDQDLLHITSYIRVLQSRSDRTTAGSRRSDRTSAEPQEFVITGSVIPAPPAGPSGLSPTAFESPAEQPAPGRRELPDPRIDPDRPPNAHLFFGLYFMMTGLHGIHVLGGMILISWLLVRAWRGDFTRGYFTPVDLVGLYWHVVDVIWIFLFPLQYLIS